MTGLVIEDVSTPPVPCAKEGCVRPFSCVCPEDEACHIARLEAVAPKARTELEMPPRG